VPLGYAGGGPTGTLKPPTEAHSFWAAWNAGELGSTPAPDILMSAPPFGPVWNVGSGKLGTPWERMRRDIASAWALALAVWAAVGTPPFGK
jgi:hypothetical protein